MHEDEMLELMPVLLRDTASDFYDNLAPDARATWQNFKRAFLERFGRSEALRWRDANSLTSAVGPRVFEFMTSLKS